MSTTRFNVLVFKALSNTGIHGCVQPTILSTRQFARTPSTKSAKPKKEVKAKAKAKAKPKQEPKPKRVTKKDEKIQKLLKRYPDPQQPKRPATSYIRFMSEYKKKNGLQVSPDTMGTVSRSVATAWRQLPDREKAKYTESFANDRKKYKDAKKKYDESGRGEKWLEKIIKLAEEKPAKSGYQLFMKKRFPQNKEKHPMSSVPQIMSVKYHSLPKISR